MDTFEKSIENFLVPNPWHFVPGILFGDRVGPPPWGCCFVRTPQKFWEDWQLGSKRHNVQWVLYANDLKHFNLRLHPRILAAPS